MPCPIKIPRDVVTAGKEVGFAVPLAVRLEDTNAEPAREILEKAKSEIPTMQVGTDITDAAQKMTAAVA